MKSYILLCSLLFLHFANPKQCTSCSGKNCNAQITVKICSRSESSVDDNIFKANNPDVICIYKEYLDKDITLSQEEMFLKCVCKSFRENVVVYICDVPSNHSLIQYLKSFSSTHAEKYSANKLELKQALIKDKQNKMFVTTTSSSNSHLRFLPKTDESLNETYHSWIILRKIPVQSQNGISTTEKIKGHARSVEHIFPRNPWQPIVTTTRNYGIGISEGIVDDPKKFERDLSSSPVVTNPMYEYLNATINWNSLVEKSTTSHYWHHLMEKSREITTNSVLDLPLRENISTPESSTSTSTFSTVNEQITNLSWNSWYRWQMDLLENQTNGLDTLLKDLDYTTSNPITQTNTTENKLENSQNGAITNNDIGLNTVLSTTVKPELAFKNFLHAKLPNFHDLNKTANRFKRNVNSNKKRLVKPKKIQHNRIITSSAPPSPSSVNKINKLNFYIQALFNESLTTQSPHLDPLGKFVNLTVISNNTKHSESITTTHSLNINGMTITTKHTPDILDFVFPNQLNLWSPNDDDDNDDNGMVEKESPPQKTTLSINDYIGHLFTTPILTTSIKPTTQTVQVESQTSNFSDILDVLNTLPTTPRTTTHNYLSDSLNWRFIFGVDNTTEINKNNHWNNWYAGPFTEETTRNILDNTLPYIYEKNRERKLKYNLNAVSVNVAANVAKSNKNKLASFLRRRRSLHPRRSKKILDKKNIATTIATTLATSSTTLTTMHNYLQDSVNWSYIFENDKTKFTTTEPLGTTSVFELILQKFYWTSLPNATNSSNTESVTVFNELASTESVNTSTDFLILNNKNQSETEYIISNLSRKIRSDSDIFSDTLNKLPTTIRPTTHNYLKDSINWTYLIGSQNVQQVSDASLKGTKKILTTTSVLDISLPASFFTETNLTDNLTNSIIFRDFSTEGPVNISSNLKYTSNVTSIEKESDFRGKLPSDGSKLIRRIRSATKRRLKKISTTTVRRRKPDISNSTTSSLIESKVRHLMSALLINTEAPIESVTRMQALIPFEVLENDFTSTVSEHPDESFNDRWFVHSTTSVFDYMLNTLPTLKYTTHNYLQDSVDVGFMEKTTESPIPWYLTTPETIEETTSILDKYIPNCLMMESASDNSKSLTRTTSTTTTSTPKPISDSSLESFILESTTAKKFLGLILDYDSDIDVDTKSRSITKRNLMPFRNDKTTMSFEMLNILKTLPTNFPSTTLSYLKKPLDWDSVTKREYLLTKINSVTSKSDDIKNSSVQFSKVSAVHNVSLNHTGKYIKDYFNQSTNTKTPSYTDKLQTNYKTTHYYNTYLNNLGEISNQISTNKSSNMTIENLDSAKSKFNSQVSKNSKIKPKTSTDHKLNKIIRKLFLTTSSPLNSSFKIKSTTKADSMEAILYLGLNELPKYSFQTSQSNFSTNSLSGAVSYSEFSNLSDSELNNTDSIDTQDNSTQLSTLSLIDNSITHSNQNYSKFDINLTDISESVSTSSYWLKPTSTLEIPEVTEYPDKKQNYFSIFFANLIDLILLDKQFLNIDGFEFNTTFIPKLNNSITTNRPPQIKIDSSLKSVNTDGFKNVLPNSTKSNFSHVVSPLTSDNLNISVPALLIINKKLADLNAGRYEQPKYWINKRALNLTSRYKRSSAVKSEPDYIFSLITTSEVPSSLPDSSKIPFYRARRSTIAPLRNREINFKRNANSIFIENITVEFPTNTNSNFTENHKKENVIPNSLSNLIKTDAGKKQFVNRFSKWVPFIAINQSFSQYFFENSSRENKNNTPREVTDPSTSASIFLKRKNATSRLNFRPAIINQPITLNVIINKMLPNKYKSIIMGITPRLAINTTTANPISQNNTTTFTEHLSLPLPTRPEPVAILKNNSNIISNPSKTNENSLLNKSPSWLNIFSEIAQRTNITTSTTPSNGTYSKFTTINKTAAIISTFIAFTSNITNISSNGVTIMLTTSRTPTLDANEQIILENLDDTDNRVNEISKNFTQINSDLLFPLNKKKITTLNHTSTVQISKDSPKIITDLKSTTLKNSDLLISNTTQQTSNSNEYEYSVEGISYSSSLDTSTEFALFEQFYTRNNLQSQLNPTTNKKNERRVTTNKEKDSDILYIPIWQGSDNIASTIITILNDTGDVGNNELQEQTTFDYEARGRIFSSPNWYESISNNINVDSNLPNDPIFNKPLSNFESSTLPSSKSLNSYNYLSTYMSNKNNLQSNLPIIRTITSMSILNSTSDTQTFQNLNLSVFSTSKIDEVETGEILKYSKLPSEDAKTPLRDQSPDYVGRAFLKEAPVQRSILGPFESRNNYGSLPTYPNSLISKLYHRSTLKPTIYFSRSDESTSRNLGPVSNCPWDNKLFDNLPKTDSQTLSEPDNILSSEVSSEEYSKQSKQFIPTVFKHTVEPIPITFKPERTWSTIKHSPISNKEVRYYNPTTQSMHGTKNSIPEESFKTESLPDWLTAKYFKATTTRRTNPLPIKTFRPRDSTRWARVKASRSRPLWVLVSDEAPSGAHSNRVKRRYKRRDFTRKPLFQEKKTPSLKKVMLVSLLL